MPTTTSHHITTCLALTTAISKCRTVEDIYTSALDALASGLGVHRASILLFDQDGVMRFKAFRGLSQAYRQAVEGHTPWQPDTPDPRPICVPDVATDASLSAYLPVFDAEGIAAMAFVPLLSMDRVIGKFMLYYEVPTAPTTDDLQLAAVIAAQVAFAVEKTRAEQHARRSEERLRFALDAASMGTWDWDLTTNAVIWSDNLASIHGLPPGSFDGTFASYEREIHPDDREKVFASVQRALSEGVPHDVEYRIVAPDGAIRWCEGKGRVERADGQPVRMSGVCMMVTRRKEAELARLAAAEESSRLKDDFLATLSHELRTPLNAILGWVQMLQAGELSPARARQGIEVVARNARLQAQLIEDILDVSRIITGKLEIEPVPVSVVQLLDTVLAGIAPTADSKRIVLARDLDAESPPVHADPRRLHQIFNNVLSNAVKFTPESGSITVRCAAASNHLQVDVHDSGIGVSPEFLPHIFDRFRQADGRATRAHGGLGLGLAIAKHLVQLHGGVIRAASDGQGKGTTISIVLPVAGDVALRPDTEMPVQASVPRLDNVTVLLVDDQRDSREMLSALLEQRGALVQQTDSAESALAMLHRHTVDVLIADIAMPRVDGYELLRRLRRSGNKTPAIAVTAFAGSDDRQRAIQSGYEVYLAKPIDGVELAQIIRDTVASQDRFAGDTEHV